VPFGTGQGTINISQLNQAGHQYEVYHPLVFDFLKGFLTAAADWLLASEKTTAEKETGFHRALEKCLPASGQKDIDPVEWLQNLFIELQVFKNLDAAEKRSKSPEGALQQFDDWFDGFRTMKLIHRLRDDLYGSLPLIDALQISHFLQKPRQDNGHFNSREEWLKRLRSAVL
jgi:hypothetical protein